MKAITAWIDKILFLYFPLFQFVISVYLLFPPFSICCFQKQYFTTSQIFCRGSINICLLTVFQNGAIISLKILTTSINAD